MAEEKKRCPHCAEEILVAANKCKHCGEWLGEARKKDSSMARAVSRGIKQKSFSKVAFKCKLLLLLGAFALALKVIDEVSKRVFHLSLATAPEWVIPYIMIPLLLVALIFVWRFIQHYYEE